PSSAGRTPPAPSRPHDTPQKTRSDPFPRRRPRRTRPGDLAAATHAGSAATAAPDHDHREGSSGPPLTSGREQGRSLNRPCLPGRQTPANRGLCDSLLAGLFYRGTLVAALARVHGGYKLRWQACGFDLPFVLVSLDRAADEELRD